MLKSFLDTKLIEKPWFFPAITALILLIVVFILIIILYAISKKNGIEISFLGLKIKTTPLGQELAEEIKKLNRDSEIKENVIFLAKLFSKDFVSLVGNLDGPNIQKLANQILAGLPTILRSDSQHRRAVLVKNEKSDTLHILYGNGYSNEAIKNMTLDIEGQGSCAGEAYRNGDYYYCKDTIEDPFWNRLPKANHDYRSIINIAISTGKEVLGVLIVDAVEPNAFTKDEIANLRLFANLFAILLLIRNMIYSKEGEVASS